MRNRRRTCLIVHRVIRSVVLPFGWESVTIKFERCWRSTAETVIVGDWVADRPTFKLGVTGVAGKPRLLVIDRDSSHGKSTLECLSETSERVTVRTISKALALLRDQKFDAVYVDASQLSAVRWVGTAERYGRVG